MDALTPPEVAAIVCVTTPCYFDSELTTRNRHGPMFLGMLINAVLYGIMIAQIYFFFATYKHDELWLKSFVVLIFVLDTANTVFDFTYLYECFITHYVFATGMTGTIATLVQLFFAWRIRILTAKNWLAIITAFLAILALAGALATAVEVGGIHPEFTEFHKFKDVVIVWLGCGCVCDILITTFLVWHLGKKTGFESTDYVVDKIIRMTVQTGLITSLCAVVDLVTFLTLNNGVHLIFNFPLCKLYTNSLMSSLNARETTPSATGGKSRGSTTLSVSNRLSKNTIDMVGAPTCAQSAFILPSPSASFRMSRGRRYRYRNDGVETPGLVQIVPVSDSAFVPGRTRRRLVGLGRTPFHPDSFCQLVQICIIELIILKFTRREALHAFHRCSPLRLKLAARERWLPCSSLRAT
ncbi:hypothetical protein BDZ89DRAFT_943357 [Hymenopellis radicata]|nr:hypothetical protein BDZ89DRAFT_943357 [Hymenopellis radicata]